MKLTPLPDDPFIIADAMIKIMLVAETTQKAREDIAELVTQLIEAYPPPYTQSTEFFHRSMKEYFETAHGKTAQQEFQKKVAEIRADAHRPEWEEYSTGNDT